MNRGRRLRTSKLMRDMVAETSLSADDFIYPIFVIEGENIKEEIPSMKNVHRYSLDRLPEELAELSDLDIRKILIFGIPAHKDGEGSEAYSDTGIVQKAVRLIKEQYPDFLIITAVCMCQYTSHGHCGILTEDGEVDNDITLNYLGKIALSHARAGADIIAPSDMMDGRIKHIRDVLDNHGFKNTALMSYSAKYASNFYGPFRDAAESAPSFGDRKTYQMDYRNSDEAMREHRYDIAEGADIIMVKPALSYLDIIRRSSEEFDVPIAAYNVSGEYSMVMNAIERGLVNENIIDEVLHSIKRAGAQIIITYHAKDYVKKHGLGR